MKCKYCNNALSVEDKFCKNCGNRAVEGNVNEVNNNVENINEMNNVNQNQDRQNYSMNQNYNEPEPRMKQNYNNPGQNMRRPKKAKSNDSVKYIVIGAVSCLAFVLVFTLVSRSTNLLSNNNAYDPNVTETGNTNSLVYKVLFGGFQFSVPDNYIYDFKNNYLYLANSDDEWVASIAVHNGSFDNVKANRGSMQSFMISKGFSATPAKLNKYNGLEYVYLEASDSTVTNLFAYAPLSKTHTVSIIVESMDGVPDYDALEDLAPILSSATYYGSSANIEVEGNSMDANEFFEALK